MLAARPSMGKTSFALNVAEAVTLPKRGEPFPTLIFSLEMSGSQLALRMLCSRARVKMQAAPRRGPFEERRRAAAARGRRRRVLEGPALHR